MASPTIDLLRRLQAVQNAAARSATGTRRCDHITPVLRHLHWLPVRRRVEFKLAVPGLQGSQRPVTTVFVRWLPARYWSSSSSSVVEQFQVLNYEHQFKSRRSYIFCCRTKNLEQSAYTTPSAWFVTWQFLPKAENVFCCSRYQRLVTVAFRRCV